MNTKKNLKNNIQKYRKWKNLSQIELANSIDFSVTELRLVEKQKHTPREVTRNKIVNFFGVSYGQMFYKDDE